MPNNNGDPKGLIGKALVYAIRQGSGRFIDKPGYFSKEEISELTQLVIALDMDKSILEATWRTLRLRAHP